MSLINSKKHIAFSKVGIPKDGVSRDNPKAFFCVEEGGGFLFHISQKKGVNPNLFKSPQKIQAFLKKKKFLPSPTFTLNKKAKLVCGIIWKEGSKFGIEITSKVNGGGKSTLKKALPIREFKLPKLDGFVYGEPEETEEDTQINAEVEGVKAGFTEFASTNKRTQKSLKLFRQIEAHLSALASVREQIALHEVASPPNREELDDLLRHLHKYLDKGCEAELTSKASKLKKFNIDITPFTQSQVRGWIQHATEMIDAIDAENDEAAEEADGEAAAREDELTGDEAIAARDEIITEMWFGGNERAFRKCREKYLTKIHALWSDFKDNPEVVSNMIGSLATDMEGLLKLDLILE